MSGFPKPTRKRKKNHSRKRRTSERRKLELECDLLTKLEVHERDGERCLKCGKDSQLQAAHILPKGAYPLLRFVLENLLTLCLRCHLFWAHKDPVGFLDWVEAKWPGRIERLRISARMPRKLDLGELLMVLRKGRLDGSSSGGKSVLPAASEMETGG